MISIDYNVKEIVDKVNEGSFALTFEGETYFRCWTRNVLDDIGKRTDEYLDLNLMDDDNVTRANVVFDRWHEVEVLDENDEPIGMFSEAAE